MTNIETTVEDFDDISLSMKRFKYFTIGKGKAKYHMIHVPDGTVGYYYAIAASHDRFARRALKPGTKIVCHGE